MSFYFAHTWRQIEFRTYNQIFFLNAFLAFLAGSAKIMWKIDVNPFWRLPLEPHYLFILHSAAICAACDERVKKKTIYNQQH